MLHSARYLSVFALVFLMSLLVFIGYQHQNSSELNRMFVPPKPAKIHQTPIDKPEEARTRRPDEWIEITHPVAPGQSWKALEAASLRTLAESSMQGSEMQESTLPIGVWKERGPSNIPGRITDMDIDFAGQKIYAVSDYGIIFTGSLTGTDWQPLNDQFPLALGVASFIKAIQTGSNIRIIVGGWQKTLNGWGIFYSDDNGETWQQSVGLNSFPIMGLRRVQVSNDANHTVYAFVQEYNQSIPTDYYSVYKSVNLASNFTLLYRSQIPVGDGGRHNKSDMWLPPVADPAQLYLALEDSVFAVQTANGNRTYKGLISGIAGLHGCLLTGTVQGSTIRLRAWIGNGDDGKFYASNDNANTWQFKGQYSDWVGNSPFGPNSFSCTPATADTLYFGGILTIRSNNAGQTWTIPDMDPTQSYVYYHGDVPKTLCLRNPDNGQTEVWLGTDGGIYKLNAVGNHFNSLSIPGLNCTQIYKMATTHTQPGNMYIGTQDNGYAVTQLGNTQTGIVDFAGVWGGDVSNIASGDNGQTFWTWWLGDGCNYVNDPVTNGVPSTWSPYWVNGQVPYWEAPIFVPQQQPSHCFTAGYINNTTGNYLLRLKAMTNADAQATQYPYNFATASGGNKISAIAISPLDSSYWYIATGNGYFFRSSNAGGTWQSLQLSPYLYARVIYPSKTQLGKVWVGGSGYSNSPVYYSSNHGATFAPLNNGLPACTVEAIDGNEDETVIFAATSIAPFVLLPDEGQWYNMAGTKAPLVNYMDVEYIPSINTVRYATYARGVWDFDMDACLATAALITGSTLVCANNAEVYLYNTQPIEGATYTWSVSNGTILNGQGSSQIEVVWNSETAGSVMVTVEQ